MKYSILFWIETERGTLRMTIRYKMKRISYNVGCSVDERKWDKNMQRCKRNTTHGKESVPAARINAIIQRYENKVRRLADGYISDPTPDEFKHALDNVLRETKESHSAESFFELYERFIDEEKSINDWSKGTIYKHMRLYKDWEIYFPKITLEQINEETLNEFRECLIEAGLQNETIKKRISMSKWFFRWLLAKGYLKDVSFTAYRPKLKRSSRCVVFLTWEELMAVYNHRFPEEKNYLDRVRDVFCFCCFSSLRYSDVYALKKTDIYEGCINFTTQKTNDKLRIELNKYTSAILDKYKDLAGEEALPVISNQKMNKYLKEVCFECGIDEPLTEITYIGGKKVVETKEKWQMVGTHCGRRTFICNAIMLGIPPNVVMKWTGHSDYKSMKPYIDIADKTKVEAMKMFDKN